MSLVELSEQQGQLGSAARGGVERCITTLLLQLAQFMSNSYQLSVLYAEKDLAGGGRGGGAGEGQ